MRLGILIYSLSGGGAERVVSYLLTHCISKEIDVHLIMMNTGVNYDIPKSTRIHYIENSNPNEHGVIKALKIPFLAYKYARLVKKLELTHSLSFLTRPSFINVLSRFFTSYKFKVITNERAFPTLQYSYKGFQSWFNKKMIKSLYKKSEAVISNSNGNANDLISNFKVPSDKMYVIHNPIDLDKISDINPKEDFFDATKFNIITIGRLDIGKNHKMIINAINKLNNTNIHLYIIGSGPMQSELEDLVEKLNLKNQVFLLGYQANPYGYLKSANLFAFGSNHEGFPNVLLEAMACNIPIISTNCQSGPSEILKLQNDKSDDIMITDYGILTPVKNDEAMAKGISHFLDNKSFTEKCKINGLKRIKDFDKEKILNQYIDLVGAV
ncbi:MAG: glycosyltransferase [Flavobacteriaceae bacterium]|nr:glycosyltransferase [Flavobacteriaceae bacterium]